MERKELSGPFMMISNLKITLVTTFLQKYFSIARVKNKRAATFNPLTSRPECMPGSRYTGVGVLFFVI